MIPDVNQQFPADNNSSYTSSTVSEFGFTGLVHKVIQKRSVSELSLEPQINSESKQRKTIINILLGLTIVLLLASNVSHVVGLNLRLPLEKFTALIVLVCLKTMVRMSSTAMTLLIDIPNYTKSDQRVSFLKNCFRIYWISFLPAINVIYFVFDAICVIYNQDILENRKMDAFHFGLYYSYIVVGLCLNVIVCLHVALHFLVLIHKAKKTVVYYYLHLLCWGIMLPVFNIIVIAYAHLSPPESIEFIPDLSLTVIPIMFLMCMCKFCCCSSKTAERDSQKLLTTEDDSDVEMVR